MSDHVGADDHLEESCSVPRGSRSDPAESGRTASESANPPRKTRRYSGPSGRRHSSIPGYDRERDATITTNAAFNVIWGGGLGGAIGFAVAGETDFSALTALAGAILGLLLGLWIEQNMGRREGS